MWGVGRKQGDFMHTTMDVSILARVQMNGSAVHRTLMNLIVTPPPRRRGVGALYAQGRRGTHHGQIAVARCSIEQQAKHT